MTEAIKEKKKAEKKSVTKKPVSKTQPKKSETAGSADGFAVIETGGKQYIVAKGKRIKIEKIKGDFKEGDKLTFEKVLLKDDESNTEVGSPNISGAEVQGKITKIGKGEKVTIIKYKQKSRYFIKKGHRQPYFEVEII